MKLIAIYLYPEEIEDDINLTVIEVPYFDEHVIYDEIENIYDVIKDTFHYYEPTTWADGNGTFTTLDDEGVEFQWIFETRDIS